MGFEDSTETRLRDFLCRLPSNTSNIKHHGGTKIGTRGHWYDGLGAGTGIRRK